MTHSDQSSADELNRAFGARNGGRPQFTAEAEGDDYLFGPPPDDRYRGVRALFNGDLHLIDPTYAPREDWIVVDSQTIEHVRLVRVRTGRTSSTGTANLTSSHIFPAPGWRRNRHHPRTGATMNEPRPEQRDTTIEDVIFDKLGDTFTPAVTERLAVDVRDRLIAAGWRPPVSVPEDLAELRTKARAAAVEGPWAVWHDLDYQGFKTVGDAESYREMLISGEAEDCNPVAHVYTDADAEYIAAASPDVILALIDRLAAAQVSSRPVRYSLAAEAERALNEMSPRPSVQGDAKLSQNSSRPVPDPDPARRFSAEDKATLIEFAAARIQSVWDDVGSTDAMTLAQNVVAAQEFAWLSMHFPVQRPVPDTEDDERRRTFESMREIDNALAGTEDDRDLLTLIARDVHLYDGGPIQASSGREARRIADAAIAKGFSRRPVPSQTPEPTDAQIEAAADAMYFEDCGEAVPDEYRVTDEFDVKFREYARVALIAAARVGTTPEGGER